MSQDQYLSSDLDLQLAHVIEECGEVLAAAGKTQRFGWLSGNPELPATARETNRDWLLREMADLSGALDRLRETLCMKSAGWMGEEAEGHCSCIYCNLTVSTAYADRSVIEHPYTVTGSGVVCGECARERGIEMGPCAQAQRGDVE